RRRRAGASVNQRIEADADHVVRRAGILQRAPSGSFARWAMARLSVDGIGKDGGLCASVSQRDVQPLANLDRRGLCAALVQGRPGEFLSKQYKRRWGENRSAGELRRRVFEPSV